MRLLISAPSATQGRAKKKQKEKKGKESNRPRTGGWYAPNLGAEQISGDVLLPRQAGPVARPDPRPLSPGEKKPIRVR